MIWPLAAGVVLGVVPAAVIYLRNRRAIRRIIAAAQAEADRVRRERGDL